MDFICVFLGILFTIVGFLFFFGKAHIHLSAWKNMPQEEKKQIQILPLCRNIGGVIILSGIIFLLKGLWVEFSNHWFMGSMVAWLVIAGLYVWYITKSQRYKQ